MMRAAIAGAGFIAHVHAHALRAIGVEVAAVCGSTQEKAAAFGHGTAPYHNLGELLEREHVDVLHVCTPNNVHAEQALAALDRGVHVVCEKPLAVSTDESARLVAVTSERGLVGATCYHVRGYPLVEEMRVAARSGGLGRISCVHGRYLCDDVLFPASGWRQDPARSGPSYVVADLGTHWLDLAEHVTGLQVTDVLADFGHYAGGPLEDYAALLLRLEGGGAGSLVLSAGAAGRKNQLLFECEGSDAGLTWDQEAPTVMLARQTNGPTHIVVKDPAANTASARPLSRYPAGHAEGYGGAFQNIFRKVYRAIAGEPHDPFPTFADGHRGVALVEAAVASARSGSWARVL